MKNFRWRLIIFILSVIIVGCGDNKTFLNDEDVSAKKFRLVSADEFFADGSSEDRSVEITYNEKSEKLYKEIDEFLIQYTYSSLESKHAYNEQSFVNSGTDGICTIVLDEDKVVEKRFNLIDNQKGSIAEKTTLFFYDEYNNIDKEQHLDSESTVELDVYYRYAYSNDGEDDFILIEKHYVSNENDIKAYFRYSADSQKPSSIEYDINGDYNIDYVTEIKYDDYNNPILADNCKYNNNGSRRTVSTVTYSWEEGIGDENDLTQLWDDSETSFLLKFR